MTDLTKKKPRLGGACRGHGGEPGLPFRYGCMGGGLVITAISVVTIKYVPMHRMPFRIT